MKRKKALSLLLALLIAAGIPMGSLAAWEDPFTDVRAGDWFYGAVKYVNTAGLFHGTAPHAFSPETPMTRGMFVTVLGKASNVDTAGYDSSQFADVPSGAYYAPYAA